MKRFCALLASVYLVAGLVGCGGGGIPEGPPAGPVTGGQTQQFKDMMERTGNKMMTKGQARAKAPSGTTK